MSKTSVMIGGMGVVAAGLLAAVMLGDAPPPPSPQVAPTRPAPTPTAEVPPEEAWEEPAAEPKKRAAVDPRLAAPPVEEEPAAPPPPTPRFAQQSQEDRQRLGDAAYAEMETLWVKGRRPRAHPDAIKAMEELLDRYPDTNRAGCARYELAQHHLKNGRTPPQERIKLAEPLLIDARQRNEETRCEFDTSAGRMASLALAMDVYRHTDRRMANTILDELSQLPPTETDRLGKPLSEKARFLKEHLPPAMERPGQDAPLPAGTP